MDVCLPVHLTSLTARGLSSYQRPHSSTSSGSYVIHQFSSLVKISKHNRPQCLQKLRQSLRMPPHRQIQRHQNLRSMRPLPMADPTTSLRSEQPLMTALSSRIRSQRGEPLVPACHVAHAKSVAMWSRELPAEIVAGTMLSVSFKKAAGEKRTSSRPASWGKANQPRLNCSAKHLRVTPLPSTAPTRDAPAVVPRFFRPPASILQAVCSQMLVLTAMCLI